MTKSAQPSSTSYRNPRIVWQILPGFMIFCALLFSSAFVAPTDHPGVRIFAAVAIAGCLFTAWRGRRIGIVRADAGGVSVFNVIRRLYWRWADVDRFAVEVLATPLMVVARPILVVYRHDGRRTVCTNVTAGPKDRTSSWLDGAVAELNERLRQEQQPS